jgi:hypothetical protein
MMIQRPRHLATAATISPGVSFGDVEVLAKIQFLAGEARGGRGGRGAAGLLTEPSQTLGSCPCRSVSECAETFLDRHSMTMRTERIVYSRRDRIFSSQ